MRGGAARGEAGGSAYVRSMGGARVVWAVVLWVVAAGCADEPLLDPRADLVVYGGMVWDGTAGAEVRGPSLMQVGDGRVLSVTPLAESAQVVSAAAEAGVVAVDAMGHWVIPGLVNAHGHVGGTWRPDMGVEYGDYVAAELQRYARFGVTTVNSLGGAREPAFALRDASWGRDAPGQARLLVAGSVVTGATPDEAAKAVDAVAALDPDWVKIRVDDNLGTIPKMPPDVYSAVVQAARAHELRVASHLFYLEDAKGLLRAGTGLVAHSIRDAAADDETIGLFLETGVCYVPTLTREVSAFAYDGRPAFLDDEFLLADVDSAQVLAVSDPARQERLRNSPQPAAYRAALEVAQQNLKRLFDAGVVVAFGTDSGPLGRFQGYFEHMEMELMAEAGLSSATILHSATGAAADCLGRDDIGTLESGRWADFVVLRADPLADVRNARAIESVWVGGGRVRRLGDGG